METVRKSRAGRPRLRFLGATGTVTGSRFLVRAGGSSVLVDCGLFQGLKQLRRRNWLAPGVEPRTLDAIALTHAHLDHSGYLPAMVRDGFVGPVWCTEATQALCGVLLPDAGHLAEEDARYANLKGYSRHHPARPLYTESDARISLRSLRGVDFDARIEAASGIALTFRPAGHILGAASILLEAGGRRVLFSGDLGRGGDPLMRAPSPPPEADTVLVESTYGDRSHPDEDTGEALLEVLDRVLARGGVAVIPAFAVGRTQALLHRLAELREAGRLPAVPVFLNSPMAIDATQIYRQFRAEHRLDEAATRRMAQVAQLVRTVEESKALNARRGPMIILSASGMATGGRVIHHIKAFGGDPRNAIIFSGYQAAGTRGAGLVAGARSVRIHGQDVEIRAEVVELPNTSAHADADDLLQWLAAMPRPPRQVYVVHGEPVAADALRRRIEHELGWKARVPEFREAVPI